MKLVSWNVNGLRAANSKNAFDWLKDQNIDFLGLQEIKANEEQFPKEIYKLGFSDISFNSAQKAGYSGVMSLSNLKYQTQKAMFFDDNEGRVLEHRFGDICLFNIYFPNGQSSQERLDYKMDFYDKFLTYIKDLVKNKKSVIFCGDVNTAHKEIDLTHPKANMNTSGFLEIERAWIDKVIKAGFSDTFRVFHEGEKEKYSWWSYRLKARQRNVGWRIDYFFISNDLLPKLKDAFILSDIYGSDHCPVGIEIDL